MSKSQIKSFFANFSFVPLTNIKIVICPSFVYLSTVSELIHGKQNLCLGAQNCFYEDEGAFTGEVSAKMLRDLGVSYVILGHSERRRFFSETDELIFAKCLSALKHNLIPIVCFGEDVRSNNFGDAIKALKAQLRKIQPLLSDLILAYEPVWAIGTGITPSQHDVLKVLDYVFSVGSPKKFIYGGSVNAENAATFATITDGLLVGGSSLNPNTLAKICSTLKTVQ